MFTHISPAPQDNTLVVLSGGLDSATVLALAKLNTRKDLCTISFDYGQKHVRELEGIEKLCDYYEVNKQFTRSITALAELPGLQKKDNPTGLSPVPGILLPDTWKPGRNMVFLAIAFSYAYTLGCSVVAMGVHQEDYPGYPDCRDTFLEAMEIASIRALASPIALWTPLLYFDKAAIVKLGLQLKVPYELTWSCYKGGTTPCGECDACIRRNQAFQANDMVDPLLTKLQNEGGPK